MFEVKDNWLEGGKVCVYKDIYKVYFCMIADDSDLMHEHGAECCR